jgi:peptide/nickel transport system ATP-binding protein
MLEVEQLAISFDRYTAFLARGRLQPVRSLDLSLAAGEIMAVVGESGAGKSLLAHAVLGLLPENAKVSGSMRFCGEALTPSRIAQLRGKEIALIPQAVSYLNPLWRVGGQVDRAARLGGQHRNAAAAGTNAAFERYGLEQGVRDLFPFQLSGGMAKRVLTAAATVGKAKLILADEPTAGLDTANSRKMLSFLRLLADAGRSVLLITHDLDTALQVTDKVAVFHNGMTIEIAPSRVFSKTNGARHPYTRLLFNALPQNDFTASINGNGGFIQNDGHWRGCGFYHQCPSAGQICMDRTPPKQKTAGGWVRCHYLQDEVSCEEALGFAQDKKTTAEEQTRETNRSGGASEHRVSPGGQGVGATSKGQPGDYHA